MREFTSKSIFIGKEAHFYLDRESRKQRGCKPITGEAEERIWNRIPKVDGLRQVTDDSYGGGDGTYYGRWTRWSVEDVKKMLDEAGFSYAEGPEVEYISISI